MAQAILGIGRELSHRSRGAIDKKDRVVTKTIFAAKLGNDLTSANTVAGENRSLQGEQHDFAVKGCAPGAGKLPQASEQIERRSRLVAWGWEESGAVPQALSASTSRPDHPRVRDMGLFPRRRGPLVWRFHNKLPFSSTSASDQARQASKDDVVWEENRPEFFNFVRIVGGEVAFESWRLVYILEERNHPWDVIICIIIGIVTYYGKNTSSPTLLLDTSSTNPMGFREEFGGKPRCFHQPDLQL